MLETLIDTEQAQDFFFGNNKGKKKENPRFSDGWKEVL